MNICGCGCGQPCKNRYRQGHNKRLSDDQKLANFMKRWDKSSPEGHWLWTGPQDGRGYGMTSFMATTVRQTHRVMYELLLGAVPSGLQLDHLCRVRLCGNPEHLEPVTCRENLMRGETRAAENAAKTHCPQGHSYDESNTRITKAGTRACRTCEREHMREARGWTGRLPAKQRTHCPQGHPYDEENIRWYQGRRYCRACEKIRGRGRKR